MLAAAAAGEEGVKEKPPCPPGLQHTWMRKKKGLRLHKSSCVSPCPPCPLLAPPKGSATDSGVRLSGGVRTHAPRGLQRGAELVRKRVHLCSAYIPSEASETRTAGRAAPSRALPSLPIFSHPRQKIASQLEAAERDLEFRRAPQPIDYWACGVLTLPFFTLCYF